MSIRSDWHIHTHCSCDSASMEFETLVKEAKEAGITDYGVSDHYHTRIQETDIAASRKEYEKILEKHPELDGHFHFGIEATIISKWEVEKIIRGDYIKTADTPTYGIRAGGPMNAPVIFDFDEEFMERYKIEYVVAGMHWPMYCKTDKQSLVKEYHRQYMFAITHPYTTILAHYLWWDEGLFSNFWGIKDAKNPFLDLSVISETMRSEIKSALLECNTAYELNLGEVFSQKLPDSYKDEYMGWAAELQRSGVVLSMGSDCHKAHLSSNDYNRAEEIFRHYGIDSSVFFCL